MPRSGGVYTLPVGNPVTTLTVISSSWANTTMGDIAGALTGSLPIDGTAVMTGQLRLVDGSVAAPGMSWANEPNSGWYRIGAGQLGFSVLSSLALSVNANRGWNIPAPVSGSALTINGAGSSTTNPLYISVASGNYGLLLTPAATTQTPGIVVTDNTQTRKLEILSVGSTAPAGYGAAAGSQVINAQGGLTLSTNDLARIGINSTGNVTVNAPSSGATLSLVTTAVLQTALTSSDGTSTFQIQQAGGAGSFIGTSSNHVLNVITNNTNRVVIAGGGNVTVNAPTSGAAFTVNGSPSSGAYALTVVAATAGSYGLALRGGASASDVCADFLNAANTLLYLRILGEGSLIVGAPTGGAQGIGTVNATGLYVNGQPIYSGIPINPQSVNYTLVLSDANKAISQANAAGSVTVPANASVAFPVGTAVTIYNNTVGNITIPITTDAMRFGPSALLGTRTLGQNGMATIVKIAGTTWVITGTGLS